LPSNFGDNPVDIPANAKKSSEPSTSDLNQIRSVKIAEFLE
jgi:hypothetical protein